MGVAYRKNIGRQTEADDVKGRTDASPNDSAL